MAASVTDGSGSDFIFQVSELRYYSNCRNGF